MSALPRMPELRSCSRMSSGTSSGRLAMFSLILASFFGEIVVVVVVVGRWVVTTGGDVGFRLGAEDSSV